MKTMSNKLLPCPFCSGEAKYDNSEGCDYIFCDECGARTFGFNKEHAFNEWNKRAKYVNNVNNKGNSSEFPNSSKEMPLVPKWKVLDSCMLDVPISQRETLQFTIRKLCDNEYWCEVGISIWESLADYTEEVGTFKTLEEAKAKVNECIRELGERLVYFAENIRIEE